MQKIILTLLAAVLLPWQAVTAAGGDQAGLEALSHPLMRGKLEAAWLVPAPNLYQASDSITVDPNHPAFRYPGRAMLMSMLIPGSGQIYVHRPWRGVIFIGIDLAAYFVWKDFNQQGNVVDREFRAFANDHWDFRDWVFNAPNFQGGEWDRVGVSKEGTHELYYFVEDMDGDGRPEYIGSTGDPDDRLEELLSDPDTSSHVIIRKSSEYYENIGKYNQFFSGWDDADPANPDIENTKTGDIAWSANRRAYVNMRGEANRLKSLATYAVSAILFNHVVSATDALFSASRWNRSHAVKIGGRLIRDLDQVSGFKGVEVSIRW